MHREPEVGSILLRCRGGVTRGADSLPRAKIGRNPLASRGPQNENTCHGWRYGSSHGQPQSQLGSQPVLSEESTGLSQHDLWSCAAILWPSKASVRPVERQAASSES